MTFQRKFAYSSVAAPLIGGSYCLFQSAPLPSAVARIARVVIPGYPHHVTQRGNRRQTTYFGSEDYEAYVDLVAAAKERAGADIWAYCVMPNHVHFVVVPAEKDSLAALFSDAHRKYTRKINFREGWRGHLWQERFHSFVMDEHHLLAAVRYIELNPVHANLCTQAALWPWSSARAHLSAIDDALVNVGPMLSRINDWQAYLDSIVPQETIEKLRQHSRTGRPVGDPDFVRHLELLAGRSLAPKKRGRKSLPVKK